MVLNYRDYPTTPQELASQVFTPKANGSFPVEMDITARRQGVISYPVTNISHLLQEIAAGNPVLVLQNLGVSWYPKWHFAVVIGYDLARRELVLRSGDLPRRITPLSVFERTWQRSDHWGRVVIRPGELPASAQMLKYLEVVSELERSGHLLQAITAYHAAASAWPDAPMAYFGLANALVTDQQIEPAIAAYRQLLQKSPDFAAGWNNYAYALKSAGCHLQAQSAASCARALAPDDTNVADTYREMSELPADSPATCPALDCPLISK